MAFFPATKENLTLFYQMANLPLDDTFIVEMNDQTARDINVIWASIENAKKTWRGEQEAHVPGMPCNRIEMWGAFSMNHLPRPHPVVEDFIEKHDGEGKVALDLGCGNSPSIGPLLQHNWRVVGVDYSAKALATLEQLYPHQIKSGKLSLVQSDVTNYEPLENFDLVIATDVFNYVDPSKFHNLWIKVHDLFLKTNGYLVGTLFFIPGNPNTVPLINGEKEMGAWFLPDRRMIKPLLKSVDYEISVCKYRLDNPGVEPTCGQFIAQKKIV